MGKDESKPCWETWAVSGFKENSAKLLDFQKKHIKDIATHIVRKLESEIKGKGEGKKFVALFPLFEGHVDKKTDPAQYGNLAKKRAIVVSDEFLDQILKEWSKRLIFRYGYGLSPKYSEAGSTRPFSLDPKKNRRVVICVRWKIESY
jgi:soluble cytochrome b562